MLSQSFEGKSGQSCGIFRPWQLRLGTHEDHHLIRSKPFRHPFLEPCRHCRRLIIQRTVQDNFRLRTIEDGHCASPILDIAIDIRYFAVQKAVCLYPNLMRSSVVHFERRGPTPNIYPRDFQEKGCWKIL